MIKNIYILLNFNFNILFNFINKWNILFFEKNTEILLWKININNFYFFFKRIKFYLYFCKNYIYFIYNYSYYHFFSKLQEKFVQFDLFFYVSKFFIRIYKNIKYYRRVYYNIKAFKKQYKLIDYKFIKKIYKGNKMDWFSYWKERVKNDKLILKKNIIFTNNLFYSYFKLKKRKLFHLKFWKQWRKIKMKLKLKDIKKIVFWSRFLRLKDEDLNFLLKNFKFLKLKNNLNFLKIYERKGLKFYKLKKKK